ncbi:flagella synthesis protein FlgN [Paraherbaspirillum soli]|uniref:Flagella synthesis protein FlgN n=1 Tax=Paraherbaspirillum soli TaxID=631222 RepID=A0ABW0MCR2_9BURK
MSAVLLEHLTEERVAMEAFLELLDQEAEALIQGHFNLLPQLTERKAQLADRIAVLDQERERQQQASGYPANRQGADAVAAASGPGLQQVWHELLERAAQARESNHRNGVLIHTHLDFVRQSINFMRASGQNLYGPDGKHKVGMGSGNSIAAG